MRRGLAVLAVTIGATFGGMAAASQYPTFTLDLDQSTISVTKSGCAANCGVDGTFTQPGTVDVSFTDNGQWAVLSDIINWDISAMVGLYDIAVNLVFTSPDLQSAVTNTKGLFLSFFGKISLGIINWDKFGTRVTFDQGSTIAVRMQKDVSLGFGPSVNSDIVLRSIDLVALNAPSPAPIPAALPALLLALSGLFFVGRRQQRMSA